MFSSTPGSEPACGDAERGQAPVVPGQKASKELARGCTKIAVRRPEAVLLGIRGHGTTRVEDLGPPRARSQPTECPLSVRKFANGGQKSPSLGDAATQ